MEPELKSFLNSSALWEDLKGSIRLLSPRTQIKNPVMFAAYLAAIFMTIYALTQEREEHLPWFEIQLAVWIWLTVLFANLAEVMAQSRGKAQAASLRKTQSEIYTKRLKHGVIAKVAAGELRKGDIIICEAGDIIPVDGEVIEGVALVDEAAITGESAPVMRESGGGSSSIISGTTVISDHLKIKVTSEKGNSFLDHVISIIGGEERKETPNEMSLQLLLGRFTIIFLLMAFSLKSFVDYSAHVENQDLSGMAVVPILTALFICLIPTTVSALLNAISIAGMDRLAKCNVIAKSGRSIETAADIDLLVLDKTGTITTGNREALAFMPVLGGDEKELAKISQLASLSDDTTEGRSIVRLAKEKFGFKPEEHDLSNTKAIPFSSDTRISGIDFFDSKGKVVRQIRKGAADAIKKHVEALGGFYWAQIDGMILTIAQHGGTPVLVSDNQKIIGVIQLDDSIKAGVKNGFEMMRKIGVRTLMVTGDNPLTAAVMAAECSVDDFIAEATPEIKLAFIKREQQAGRVVMMVGDGTSDAPALAQADLGITMNTGTQASREAGNMIDLDSNPAKISNIVIIGKQIIMTRGVLTMFSLVSSIAKSFAVIPAILGGLYLTKLGTKGILSQLNILGLHSAKSAVLSGVIFNALIILGLIPLALRGVRYQGQSADALLFRNLLIYGLGGILVPFLGIKLIDLILVQFSAV